MRFTGVFLDITERKKADEQQTLLMREVDHRAKDYQPDVWDDQRTESGTTTTQPESTDGAHRATTSEGTATTRPDTTSTDRATIWSAPGCTPTSRSSAASGTPSQRAVST